MRWAIGYLITGVRKNQIECLLQQTPPITV